MKPGLNSESFKITLSKNMVFTENKEIELQVISEPKKVPVERFLLESDDFSQAYDTCKGAKIAKSKRKFTDYSIEPIMDFSWEYEVKINK